MAHSTALRFGLLGVFLVLGCVAAFGYRTTVDSWGVDHEAALVDVTKFEPGQPLPNGFVKLKNYAIIDDAVVEADAQVFVPLAPLPPGGEIPTDDAGMVALRKKTVLIAAYHFQTGNKQVAKLFAESEGLVDGEMMQACSDAGRELMAEALDLDSVDTMYVVDLGARPALTRGLIMLIGGLAGVAAICFVSWRINEIPRKEPGPTQKSHL